MPLSISSAKEVQGSVVYKELKTGEIMIEFLSAKIRDDSAKAVKAEDNLEYPQQPTAQEWIVDYPMLAYKHFSPGNHEICIADLSQN